ncbi:MAG: winged helix-turn-helix domain-containing protein [Candidatus Micrarchaeales archaeon]|nr:winged helix-turn-helix domain-containing protein [Candidatus Micrarchaeales archaeon]
MPETKDILLGNITVTKDITRDEYAGAQLFAVYFGCASEKGINKTAELAGRRIGGLEGRAFTLDDLVDNGLLAKFGDGFYLITDRGAEVVERLRDFDENWEELFGATKESRKINAENAFHEMLATFGYGGNASHRIAQLIAIGKKGRCDAATAARIFGMEEFTADFDWMELEELDLVMMAEGGGVRLSTIGEEVYRRLISKDHAEGDLIDAMVEQANALIAPEPRSTTATG